MRPVWMTILFLLSAWVVPADDKIIPVLPVAGNLSVALQDIPGHQTPVVDFFRRYERVVRQLARFNNTAESRPLILLLNARQPPGSCRFVYSQQLKCRVLQIQGDWQSLTDSPQVGRRITMALLQSRMGRSPELALPAGAWWIADGIWAEFVQRETQQFPILHFTYLPELRNLAEQGFRIKLDLERLTPPANFKKNAPDFMLYSRRAQLMVEVARSAANTRQDNLLKDYCFLLDTRRMSPTDCFGTVFATAALKKLNNNPAGKTAPSAEATRFQAGYEALEKLAMRTLFTGYAPMSPHALLVRFNRINQLYYQPEKSPNVLKAELSDLPTILQRHPECTHLQVQKAAELNEFALLTPLQLRNSIIKLSNEIYQADQSDPARSTADIKRCIDDIRKKLADLQQVDRRLQEFELASQAFLYPLRFSIGQIAAEKPLPELIRQYLKRQEELLMQQ